MSPEMKEFVPLVFVLPLLFMGAISDMRQQTIPNKIVLGMLAVFALTAPLFLPLSEIGYRCIAAGAVFLLGFAGFSFRLWGGGDVKAITLLILFLPSTTLSMYAFAFSLSMFLGMATVLSLRATVGHPESSWVSLRPGTGFPMGVSIALSAVLLPSVVFFFG
ncbi:A24 family peptidase [Ruegeria marina]|uniref:Flp pilus assembly protein, protease CpaA n=1 Tax=Ruegeria marina TaxID=639004 RepID=A0A1G7FA60_9RHOB|nr:prepilin peptidase [Ruegeria marina]SDE72833.1 Flp pilus assembly protein, protease CpaA [Ruegeria marina]